MSTTPLPPPPSKVIRVDSLKQQLRKRQQSLRNVRRLENGIIRQHFDGDLPKLSSEQRLCFFDLVSRQDNEGLDTFIKEHTFMNSVSRDEYIRTHGFEDGDNGYYGLSGMNTYIYDNIGPADISNMWKSSLFYKGRARKYDFEIFKKYYLAGRIDELDPNSLARGEGLCRFDNEYP
jgi:hypothetical protein